MPRTPLEAYAFDARFGKRSVFILDPRLPINLSQVADVRPSFRKLLERFRERARVPLSSR